MAEDTTDLKRFIEDKLRRGYSLESIKLDLMSSGYPFTVVDAAIHSISVPEYPKAKPPKKEKKEKKEKPLPTKQKMMKRVEELYSKGFSNVKISDILRSEGYSATEADRVINEVAAKKTSKMFRRPETEYDEIVNDILRYNTEGYSKVEIIDKLRHSGYTPKDVDSAMREAFLLVRSGVIPYIEPVAQPAKVHKFEIEQVEEMAEAMQEPERAAAETRPLKTLRADEIRDIIREEFERRSAARRKTAPPKTPTPEEIRDIIGDELEKKAELYKAQKIPMPKIPKLEEIREIVRGEFEKKAQEYKSPDTKPQISVDEIREIIRDEFSKRAGAQKKQPLPKIPTPEEIRDIIREELKEKAREELEKKMLEKRAMQKKKRPKARPRKPGKPVIPKVTPKVPELDQIRKLMREELKKGLREAPRPFRAPKSRADRLFEIREIREIIRDELERRSRKTTPERFMAPEIEEIKDIIESELGKKAKLYRARKQPVPQMPDEDELKRMISEELEQVIGKTHLRYLHKPEFEMYRDEGERQRRPPEPPRPPELETRKEGSRFFSVYGEREHGRAAPRLIIKEAKIPRELHRDHEEVDEIPKPPKIRTGLDHRRIPVLEITTTEMKATDEGKKEHGATRVSSQYYAIGALPKLETSIDRLFAVVKEKKVLKFSDAMKETGVERATIEKWGKILESQGLVRMHYPLMGEPSISLKEYEQQKKTEKEQAKSEKKNKK